MPSTATAMIPTRFLCEANFSYNWLPHGNLVQRLMIHRRLSKLDRLLTQVDNALRVVAGKSPGPLRSSPAEQLDEADLGNAEKRHAAGLMRVNHSGEVCAQALYQGQALTAKLPTTRQTMEQAATEEGDHLAWCEQRLTELDSQPSRLNGLWYTLSFGLGAGAGLLSDRLSLGFVAATEQQVCRHLEKHLVKLPPADTKSRAVVEEMLVDEQRHAVSALNAGGWPFPRPATQAMSVVAKIMTASSYRV